MQVGSARYPQLDGHVGRAVPAILALDTDAFGAGRPATLKALSEIGRVAVIDVGAGFDFEDLDDDAATDMDARLKSAARSANKENVTATEHAAAGRGEQPGCAEHMAVEREGAAVEQHQHTEHQALNTTPFGLSAGR